MGDTPSQDEADLDEEEDDYDEEEEQPKKRPAPTWFLVLVTVAVVVICGVACNSIRSRNTSGPSDLDAQSICHTFVERQLKAPSSAEFSGDRVTHSGSTWTVKGSVDAQNSFGAMLRKSYTCVVTPTNSSGANWTLVSLTGLE